MLFRLASAGQIWSREINGTNATKVSCNQKGLHHELSEAPLCFLDRHRGSGRWRGGGELICVVRRDKGSVFAC